MSLVWQEVRWRRARAGRQMLRPSRRSHSRGALRTRESCARRGNEFGRSSFAALRFDDIERFARERLNESPVCPGTVPLLESLLEPVRECLRCADAIIPALGARSANAGEKILPRSTAVSCALKDRPPLTRRWSDWNGAVGYGGVRTGRFI